MRPRTHNLAFDFFRSKTELITENALLRQQLIIARRQFKRPRLRRTDRIKLIFLARLSKQWKQAVVLVEPETILRWHRYGFKLFWKYKSRPKSKPRISQNTVALIRKMASENPLWGAERIRGELLKLGISHAKQTIQRHLTKDRPKRDGGQRWTTFFENHGHEIWACDFLQLYDVFFQPIFAFFIIEHASRRVVHVAVTRSPTEVWTAQQLREVMPFDKAPRFLIRDRDRKYGQAFDRVAKSSGIKIIETPVKSPQANALCERFLGSVRRECLDHVIVLGQRHLRRTLLLYADYFNKNRPHQGLAQKIPDRPLVDTDTNREVVAAPVLGGLHHHYYRRAA